MAGRYHCAIGRVTLGWRRVRFWEMPVSLDMLGLTPLGDDL